MGTNGALHSIVGGVYRDRWQTIYRRLRPPLNDLPPDPVDTSRLLQSAPLVLICAKDSKATFVSLSSP